MYERDRIVRGEEYEGKGGMSWGGFFARGKLLGVRTRRDGKNKLRRTTPMFADRTPNTDDAWTMPAPGTPPLPPSLCPSASKKTG